LSFGSIGGFLTARLGQPIKISSSLAR